MIFAYADPPYLGCGKLYKNDHHDSMVWDTVEAHAELVTRLCENFDDGWAMSLSSPSLKQILPLCPDDCRVAAWVKPFASFKPNVDPAYAWEPVVFRGGRKPKRAERDTVRDWHSENITLKKGLTGAKPPGFAAWVVELLNAKTTEGDVIVDLFPGTGAMMGVWRSEDWLKW